MKVVKAIKEFVANRRKLRQEMREFYKKLDGLTDKGFLDRAVGGAEHE